MATATATTSRKNNNGKSEEVNASDVEAQIDQIRQDISSLTKTVAAYGNGKAGKIVGQAEKASADLAKFSQSALRTVRDEMISAEKGLESHVRNKPIQSIGIAAGIGFLVALMARR